MVASKRLGFRPHRRLRHLKGIRLLGTTPTGEPGEAFFEILCKEHDESRLLLAYRSEKVPFGSSVQWSPVEIDLSVASPQILHGRQSGVIILRAFLVRTGEGPCTAEETSLDDSRYEKIVDLAVNLNQLVPWSSDRGVQFQLADGLFGVPDDVECVVAAEDRSLALANGDVERAATGASAVTIGADEDAASESKSREGGFRAFFQTRIQSKIWRHVPSMNNLSEAGQTSSPPTDQQGVMSSSSSAPHLPPLDTGGDESLYEISQSETKPYNLMERRGDIHRMLHSHGGLCEVTERHRRLHKYVSDVLREKEKRHQHILQLRAARDSTAEWRARGDAAEAKLAQLRSKWKLDLNRQVARSTAMEDAVSALQGTCYRWAAADQVLAGPQGVGRLRDLQSQLVARRSRLVTTLLNMYALGPRASSHDQDHLEESFNQWWFTGREDPTLHIKSPRPLERSDGFLSIVGLELTPQLVELVKNGVIGWSSDPELCHRAAAALGYVAHVTNLCSKYLDVPLRYPIRSRGSMSLIYNCAPSEEKSSSGSGTWLTVQQQKRRSGQSGEVSSALQPTEFTLYYKGTSRSRFAFAVFLLGKDIQQLLCAHGIKPNGSKYVLQDLYNLVAAAYSGLTHSARG